MKKYFLNGVKYEELGIRNAEFKVQVQNMIRTTTCPPRLIEQ